MNFLPKRLGLALVSVRIRVRDGVDWDVIGRWVLIRAVSD